MHPLRRDLPGQDQGPLNTPGLQQNEGVRLILTCYLLLGLLSYNTFLLLE